MYLEKPFKIEERPAVRKRRLDRSAARVARRLDRCIFKFSKDLVDEDSPSMYFLLHYVIFQKNLYILRRSIGSDWRISLTPEN